MSQAGYFHSVSMFDGPFRIKEACDASGLTISGLQAHGPLCCPEVHGEYIKIGLEPHSQYSMTPESLDRIYNLVDSPAPRIRLPIAWTT